MTYQDHQRDLARPDEIMKELVEAVNRRGLSVAAYKEHFLIQRKVGDQWIDEEEASDHQAKFAKAVEAAPKVGWRVAVRHAVVVETVLYEHNTETRG